MAAIRIQIGARLDPSCASVFNPLIAAAERARQTIGEIGRKTAEEFVGGYRDAPKKAKKGLDGVVDAAKNADKEIVKSTDDRTKQQIKFEKDVRRAHEANYKFYEAQEQKAANRRERAKEQTAATRASVISGTASGAVGAAKGAIGVAGQFARGAGVQTDLAASVGRGVELHSKAADIVNQLKLNGQTPAAGEADRLVGLSRSVGNNKGIAANDVMGVLGDFQGKSSDLETGKAVIGDLAELAKATGTSFRDMGAAAGTVNSQLADGPDKAKQLLSIMRLTTAQTAAGSVEMSDFAKQMPKLASAANQFGGDYAENLGQLTALAQMSIKGGAMNGAEAATSAGSIGRDVNKGRSEKAWTAQGLSIYSDKDKKNIKSPQQLIMESLDKTGGDRSKFGKLWANSTSAKSAQSALKYYNDAGGGQKGHDAVQAEFNKYKQTVSAEDVKKMADSKTDDTGSKVQRFNNELDRIADTAAAKVLPALEKLAPTAIQLADGMGKLVSYVVDNPAKAMMIAIAASFAKEVAASNIKGMLQSAVGGNGGAALAGLTIAAATATIITESMNKDIAKGEASAASSIDANDAAIIAAAKEQKKTGKLSPETMAKLAEINAEADAQKAEGKNAEASGPERFAKWVSGAWGAGGTSGTTAGVSAQNEFKANEGRIGAQQKDIADILAKAQMKPGDLGKAVASALQSGVIKVQVTNPGGGQPGTTGPVPVAQ